MTETPMIELKNVNKHFGKLHVLRDVSLSVGRGEVVVIIGPSGSGKSTLCRTVNRLETIDSGEILIDGEEMSQEGRALAPVDGLKKPKKGGPGGGHAPEGHPV